MRRLSKKQDQADEGHEATLLILEVFRFNGALLDAGDDLARPFGLTSARWQVMGAVWDESRTVSDIARIMGLTRQSVQRTANRLCKDGFARFQDNPAHRRAMLLALTDQGKEALQGLSRRQTEWSSALAAGLGEENLAVACGLVRELANRLEEAKGVQDE